MGIADSVKTEIVRRILGVATPARIILFGSGATGTMTPDSDIDLLIVEDVPTNRIRESVRLRRVLDDLGWPVDVLVMDKARFEETKNVFGGIAYPANKYGQVLYEAT